MSDLKHKKKERFKSKQNKSEWFIIEGVGLLGYNIRHEDGLFDFISTEDIDQFYTKLEPEESKWVDIPNQNKALEPEKYPFNEMTDSFCKMLNEKNKRYGNAALDPLVIVGKHHRLGAKIDEKLSRIMNADELKKNDLADVIGYCFLICKDKGWTNFDDQID